MERVMEGLAEGMTEGAAPLLMSQASRRQAGTQQVIQKSQGMGAVTLRMKMKN
jgi:hypothetical protein